MSSTEPPTQRGNRNATQLHEIYDLDKVFHMKPSFSCLAISRAKHRLTILCLIGPLCVSSSTYAEGQKIWSRGFSSEPANSTDRASEFVLFSLEQGELDLVGTWSYTNGAIEDETPSPIVIEGTKTADGNFWPDVRLEVRKGRKDKWERIVTSPASGERATVTIEPNAINFDLMVKLDAFKPFLNEDESGRIVLKTGRSSEFELKDLLPPEPEAKSKDDAARRQQIMSTGGSEPLAQVSPAEKDYRKILESKLFVTPADCAPGGIARFAIASEPGRLRFTKDVDSIRATPQSAASLMSLTCHR